MFWFKINFIYPFQFTLCDAYMNHFFLSEPFWNSSLQHIGRFPFTKTFGKSDFCWENSYLGRARSVYHKLREPRDVWPLKDHQRYGTGDKNNKDEKSVNGAQIFRWEVSTGKTGLPFQKFRLFRKISTGTNQKVVFYLHPNRNFRNFLANGKRF